MASHRQPRKWRSGYFGKLKLDIRSQLAIVFVSIILLVDGGCADPSAKFIPSPKRAEDALSQAMEAWKAGKPAGEIVGTKPEIYVTDNHRHRKRELGSFKILGETPGRSGRTYAVELVLKQPDEKVKTEYTVVGIDPLWIFRREDFELLMHWDHRMTDEPSAANGKLTTSPTRE